jgi:PAS domain S-box-containing protein
MVNLDDINFIYNSIPTPCIILKPDSPAYTIAGVNNAFLSSTQCQQELLLGRHFFDAFPPNADESGPETQNIIDAFEHVLRHKTCKLIKYHRYTVSPVYDGAKGGQYWNIETYPLLDEDENVCYIVQSSTDVSNLFEAEETVRENSRKMLEDLQYRKQVEHELQLSNERYNYVNKATKDSIYDWDLVNNHIAWGDAFFRSFGYTNEVPFPLEKWLALVHPDDAASCELSLNAALADKTKNNWTGEYRMEIGNGSYVFAEENGYILRDSEGHATRMIGVIRDISERKRAEAELESLKDTYSDLFHLNPLPMWVYDLSTFRFLDVNDAAMLHYGYSRAEFLSMTIRDIRAGEDVSKLEDVITNEVKFGKHHSYETRHRKKSGEYILVNVTGNAIRYGQSEARIVVAIDVTEVNRAKRALLNSEQRFRKLIQEGSDLIAIVLSDGCYKYVSPTTQRMLTTDGEEITGRKLFELVHESDRQKVLEQFKQIEDKRRIELAPFRVIDRENKLQWVETVITDLRDDETIEGIVCNSRIVTERIEQELKIKEHLDRFNAVSKATSDSIWDMDMVSGRLLWNHGINEIFGYKDIEHNFQWWYDRVHPDDVDRVAKLIEDNIAHRIPRWTSEYRFRSADGNYRYVLDRGFLIFDEQRGELLRMIGAMQDISERVTYTRTLEAQNERLKEIAWKQAHLVRAPLARIMGLISLLNEPGLDEKTHETIMAYLNDSTAELDRIIKHLVERSQQNLS